MKNAIMLSILQVWYKTCESSSHVQLSDSILVGVVKASFVVVEMKRKFILFRFPLSVLCIDKVENRAKEYDRGVSLFN